jgi:hypothetical protein
MSRANRYAFDKSLRRVDADGRLHVEKSNISKANVCPYYGREIPGYEELGLDGDRAYMLFRDPEELKAAAPTFANLPILKEHMPVSSDEPKPELVVGTIGSNVEFHAPYLTADICIWDAAAIAGIESDKVRELSCAYRYVPVMEPGKYQGESYDGRMTQIQGNHLALVEVGRAGNDVVVADSNPFHKEEPKMNMTKLGRALYVALSAASPKLAQDAKLGAVVGNARRKGLNPADIKKQLVAMDAEMSPEKMDDIIDAVLGVNDNPEPTKDEEAPGIEAKAEKSPDALVPEKPEAEDADGGAEKIKAMLEGKVDPAVIEAICKMIGPKPAEDELPDKGEKKDEPVKKEDMKGAMDAMEKRLRDQYRALETAKDAVRNIVGTPMGMDSAEEVYAFALDHLKVDHAGISDVKALAAMCKLAGNANKPVAPVAMDANTIKSIPGLDRFRAV